MFYDNAQILVESQKRTTISRLILSEPTAPDTASLQRLIISAQPVHDWLKCHLLFLIWLLPLTVQQKNHCADNVDARAGLEMFLVYIHRLPLCECVDCTSHDNRIQQNRKLTWISGK